MFKITNDHQNMHTSDNRSHKIVENQIRKIIKQRPVQTDQMHALREISFSRLNSGRTGRLAQARNSSGRLVRVGSS